LGHFFAKTRQVCLIFGALVVCALVVTTQSAAFESGSEEGCPRREAIAKATRSLLGKQLFSVELSDLIEVVDLGDHFVVKVRGRSRDYPDESRDCAKRARVAAVFVGLTLAPPEIGTVEEAPPMPKTPREVALPTATPTQDSGMAKRQSLTASAGTSRLWNVGAELGVRLGFAQASATMPSNWGGSFRLLYITRPWGLFVGGDIPSSYTLELSEVKLRLRRYSTVAGLRLADDVGANRWGADFGVTLAMLQMQQVGNPLARSATRAEAALYLAAHWALADSWLSPTVAVFAEWVPAPTAIAVEPRGTIGHASALWFGLAAGVALGRY